MIFARILTLTDVCLSGWSCSCLKHFRLTLNVTVCFVRIWKKLIYICKYYLENRFLKADFNTLVNICSIKICTYVKYKYTYDDISMTWDDLDLWEQVRFYRSIVTEKNISQKQGMFVLYEDTSSYQKLLEFVCSKSLFPLSITTPVILYTLFKYFLSS